MNSPVGSCRNSSLTIHGLETGSRSRRREVLILKTGKVEIGQDILTALRQIAAEELELPLSLVEVLSGDTTASPKKGPTVASLSITMSGPAVRDGRDVNCAGGLFEAAATRLAAPASRLTPSREYFMLLEQPPRGLLDGRR